MHIPDGYLSPQTDAVLGLASAVTAAGAAYKTAKTVKAKYIPLLSIGAAFSFTIMMFNVPIPNGTTAHATGAALLSILLGPWAAMISVSVALVIQALFFGDGGILALGANIFNMAIVLPFVSYFLYKLISGRSELESKQRIVAAAIAGYIGINIAALSAGVEFGLQPLLFHTANGTPLYSPYGLNVAVPAMLFAHLTVGGVVEGLVTALVIAYLQRSNISLLSLDNTSEQSNTFKSRRLVLGIIILALLTPLGLLATGTAWGESGLEEVNAQLGFIPQGMQRFGEFWRHALLRNYGINGLNQTFWQRSLGYLISAFAALILIGFISLFVQRIWRKGDHQNGSSSLARRK